MVKLTFYCGSMSAGTSAAQTGTGGSDCHVAPCRRFFRKVNG